MGNRQWAVSNENSVNGGKWGVESEADYEKIAYRICSKS